MKDVGVEFEYFETKTCHMLTAELGSRIMVSNLLMFQAISEPLTTSQLPTSLYNPSGLYGLKAMNRRVPGYPYPRVIKIPRQFTYGLVREKQMVKLSPLVVVMKQNRELKTFPRFMAVP